MDLLLIHMAKTPALNSPKRPCKGMERRERWKGVDEGMEGREGKKDGGGKGGKEERRDREQEIKHSSYLNSC